MKLKSLTALAAVAATLAIAGQAGAATTPKDASPNQSRSCFYGGQLNGFRAVDDQTVLLNVGVRDIYEAKLFAPSTNLKWVNGLALVSRGGGNFICSNLDADIIVPDSTGIGPQRYPVTSLRHLTPQEVAAIPKKNRP